MSRYQGRSGKDLADHLKGKGLIKTPRIMDTMTTLDRGHFCKTNPYTDAPQGIGYGTTISAPHMHAHTLEALAEYLTGDAHVLDVGSGSGYLTCCLALLVGETGMTVGLDHIEQLITNAEKNLQRDSRLKDLYDGGRLCMVTGDGREGFAAHAPYDVIHVGAATPEIPRLLIEQLRVGGKMLIPVGPAGGNQTLLLVEKKSDGNLTQRKLMGVIYGSLVDREQQLNK